MYVRKVDYTITLEGSWGKKLPCSVGDETRWTSCPTVRFVTSGAGTSACIATNNEKKKKKKKKAFGWENIAVTTLNPAQDIDIHSTHYHTHRHNTIHTLKLNLTTRNNSPVLRNLDRKILERNTESERGLYHKRYGRNGFMITCKDKGRSFAHACTTQGRRITAWW